MAELVFANRPVHKAPIAITPYEGTWRIHVHDETKQIGCLSQARQSCHSQAGSQADARPCARQSVSLILHATLKVPLRVIQEFQSLISPLKVEVRTHDNALDRTELGKFRQPSASTQAENQHAEMEKQLKS